MLWVLEGVLSVMSTTRSQILQSPSLSFERAFVDIAASEKQDWKLT